MARRLRAYTDNMLARRSGHTADLILETRQDHWDVRVWRSRLDPEDFTDDDQHERGDLEVERWDGFSWVDCGWIAVDTLEHDLFSDDMFSFIIDRLTEHR